MTRPTVQDHKSLPAPAIVDVGRERWRLPDVRRLLLVGVAADVILVLFLGLRVGIEDIGVVLLLGGAALLPGVLSAAGPRTVAAATTLLGTWAAAMVVASAGSLVIVLTASTSQPDFGAAIALSLLLFSAGTVVAILGVVGLFLLAGRILRRASGSR